MGGNTANLLEEIRKSEKDLALSSEVIILAHSSFTSQYNTFLSLSEQLENKFKELEIREHAVEIREKEVHDRKEQGERILAEKEQALEERSREVTAKLELWNETERKMKQNADKIASVVRFSVCIFLSFISDNITPRLLSNLTAGGTKFEITKERLLSFEGSLFEKMIVSNHPSQFNWIFIERDPQHFRHVLNFMLGETIQPPPTAAEQRRIEKEFEHFKIPFKFIVPALVSVPVPNPAPTLAPKLKIFSEENYPEISVLRTWLPNKRFQRIYKATKDGFRGKDFHTHCDNKGPTLILICSDKGYLFGGFSIITWNSSNVYQKSDNKEDTFIFTLTNPHNIPPTKYHCQQLQYAILRRESCGPIFGGGHDIYISDNSHQNAYSFTRFSLSYEDTTGKGNITFTGTENFTTCEIEVYSVI